LSVNATIAHCHGLTPRSNGAWSRAVVCSEILLGLSLEDLVEGTAIILCAVCIGLVRLDFR